MREQHEQARGITGKATEKAPGKAMKKTAKKSAEKTVEEKTSKKISGEKAEKEDAKTSEKAVKKMASGKAAKKSAGRKPEKAAEKSAGKEPEKVTRKQSEKPAGKTSERKSARPGSRCPVSGKCGGCSMIDVPYEEQLARKQRRIGQLLGPFGKVEPIIRMKNPDHYRNKVTSVFAPDRKGRPVCGIYRDHSHEVVPVKECRLEDRHADRIVQTVFSLLPSFKLRVYDEDRGTGLIRYVQVRTAHATREIMVTIVTASPVFPSRNNFVKALRKIHPEITTIVQNINDQPTTMVLGDREIVLYGKGYIEDILCGRRLRIASRSFYQVNSIQAEKLYNIAIDAAGLSGRERILDAYSGIGAIGLIAAERCREVLCAELNPDSVRSARANARLNGLTNATVAEADAGDFMEKMAAAGASADVLFLDPPRSGASAKFLRSAVRMGPKKIVYISCGPDTLARDLRYLTQHGYTMKKAVPIDMFPYVDHVECVTLLQKSNRKPDAKFRIDVNLEDYYRIKDTKKNQA